LNALFFKYVAWRADSTYFVPPERSGCG